MKIIFIEEEDVIWVSQLLFRLEDLCDLRWVQENSQFQKAQRYGAFQFKDTIVHKWGV